MWSKVNDSGDTYAGFRRLSKLKIPVFEGETIYIRATGGPGYSGVVTYDENGEKIKDLLDIIGDVMENTYIVEKGVKYIAPAPHQRYVNSKNETIMYNRGSGYLPYEENVSGDYKSNILTVNEDVTLRSNESVYDELDLLTGRLTQRIDENNEVLAQAVVKTVDLTVVNQDGENVSLKPIEGTMHLSTSSDTIPPLFSGEIPVEAITQNLASFIGEE